MLKVDKTVDSGRLTGRLSWRLVQWPMLKVDKKAASGCGSISRWGLSEIMFRNRCMLISFVM